MPEPNPAGRPPTRGLNFFEIDRNLHRALERRAPALLARHRARLVAFGAWVGGPLDAEAEHTDRVAPPRLLDYDPSGARIGRVAANPLYEECHREAYRRGVIGLAYGPEPSGHALSFMFGYLLSQADIGIHCPVTLTGAVAHVLDRWAPPPVRLRYLPGLVRMDGAAATGGTWATELHGGSDIGATTTRAERADADWRLTGLKWFASNAASSLALATARPDGAGPGPGGLGCYLVPSERADGSPNRYYVRRLKDKLGTRGLATAEIELDGAEAIEIAAPPEGLRCMMAALEYSRIHNAAGAAGLQRRAFVEAAAWCARRQAFGSPLDRFAMVQQALLDMQMQQEADIALALEAALAFDAALADDAGRDWLRVATALAKFRTAENAVRAAQRAVELVGGNGYTEEFATARLYRDSLVTTVWEGPANIQALELLRLVTGRRGGDQAFLDRVGAVLGALPHGLGACADGLAVVIAEARAALGHLRSHPEDGPRLARRLLELLADTLAAALLCEEAGVELAAGDARKALLAARFLGRALGGRPAVGPGADAAERHAEAVLAVEPVGAAALGGLVSAGEAAG